MRGGKRTRSQKRGDKPERKNSPEMEDAQSSVSSVSSQQDSADTMRSVLQEIRDFRAEHKVDLNKLIEEIKRYMKSELEDMKQEMYQKLSANSALNQAHETRLEEVEKRIDEVETVNMAMSDALIKSMKQQRAMQGKLVDLEGRSRRNNMRIYGVPKRRKIQRAHRAVARKPERNAPPRSIVVNFLEFNIKEKVLKKAWEKNILMEGRRLSFDHDYATEVVLKRKVYVGIKRVLKEKNIRFQTPLDRMRIHWDSGTHTYDSAQEVRRRGFSVEIPDRNASELYPEIEHLQQTNTWQRVGESSAGGDGTKN
ncbi:LINE-1 type transposase domain containing protein 1 [Dissostichus eleginoides]|uniref:LINE-1 type transposase domain containing protein 1 n=1 Tax=Dissostichus eleginoides TaxID=100907 RepID=A0AAD9CKN9_DISEL|nr:LINE-1 type transposase domain containing protein 1 [Dissostichus eleginoides]